MLGNGEYAMNEANELKNLTSDIKILTNGSEISNCDGFKIDSRKIKEFHGDTKISNIEFEDGEILEVDGVFIANGVAGGNEFAKKLGIIVKENKIQVNEKMETNIKGIFACGDLVGGLLQINKSVYEGAKAGLSVINHLKNL